MRRTMSTPSGIRERGQILVIFVGGLVTLLVVGALVIDLGFTFLIRRAEQNAADPGALAAARFIQVPGLTNAQKRTSMDAAACFYAQQNGFFKNAPGFPSDIGCVPGNDPDGSVLTVRWPPGSDAGTFAGDMGKVQVILARQHRTFLANVVGIAQIGVASSAVAAFDPGNSNSSSLIALDPGGCSGNPAGFITGGGTVKVVPVDPSIEGGYVHVNSSCGGPARTGDDACSMGSGALKVSGGGGLEAPKTYVVGACEGGPLISALDEGSVIIGDPLADLPPPSFGPPGALCGDPALDPLPISQTTEAGAEGCAFNKKDTTYHLSPGVYYGGWRVTGKNVTLHLDPGIYFMAGGGITILSTGEITSVELSTGVPAPVMIFSTDDPMYAADCKAGSGSGNQCQDRLNFTAGSDLLLHGMITGPYKGILIWQDGDGSGATAGPNLEVNLSGQTSLNLSGTIYNPRGTVTVDGGSIADGYAAVQIISWNWKIAGKGTIHMPYDPNQLYQFTYKGLVR
jgi:hypothetical protein